MLPFVEFLEEIERSNRTVVIDGAEVERLVKRFGSQVHSIGVWNRATDGSIEIPMNNITEAVQTLDNRTLMEAIVQLKVPEGLTSLLSHSPAAKQLIETLSEINLRQFEMKVQRYQNADNPAEVARLRHEISKELFGV